MSMINNPEHIEAVERWRAEGVEHSRTHSDPIYDTDFVELYTDTRSERDFIIVWEKSNWGDGDDPYRRSAIVLNDDLKVWLIQELLK